MEKFLAGAGQSVDSTVRGVRQVWNQATGDTDEYKQLQAEEAEARRLNEPLLNTKSGRAGQIIGHIAQAAVPVGGGVKAAQLAGKVIPAGLARVGTAAALGGGYSALAPTVEDESRGQNAAIGAAIGGVLPVAGRALGVVNEAKAGALRALTRAVTENKSKAEVIRRAAGNKIAELTKDVRVPLDPVARDAAKIAREYGTALPKHVRGYIAQLQNATGRNAKLTGEKLQEARSALIREAAAMKGAGKSGVERLRRVIDDATDEAIESMPKTVRDRLLGSRSRRLQQAREMYRTGQKPDAMKPYRRAAGRTAIEALRRPGPEEEN